MIVYLGDVISGYAKGIGIGLGTLTITAIPYLYKKAKNALLRGKDKGGSRKKR
ncbi:hypothetical protein bcgnr5378_64090 [Bacillus cereus]|nr:hypothetical protein [Bacillus cereus]